MKKLTIFNTFLTLGLGLTVVYATPVKAAGIVGTGNAASCNETALEKTLAGGGNVTFNCGSDPVTIKITKQKEISNNTVIDGGNKITLDGGGKTRILLEKNSASLTVKNLSFINGKTSDEGAAIMVSWRGKLIVNNCKFDNNIADKGGEAGGGAIFLASESSADISNSVFSNNKGSLGGAIRNLLSNLTITNTKFNNNQARSASGGAIYIDGANGDNGKITIKGSSFTGNKAATQGGALFNFLYNKNVTTIENTTFSGNTADQGGGIWTSGGNLGGLTGFTGTGNQSLVNITQATINGNLALSQGGGIWHGTHQQTTITNSTISDNKARSNDGKNGLGGGVMLTNKKITFNGVKITNNYAAFQGGAIFGGDTDSVLINSSILNNKADNGGNNWNVKISCSHALKNGGNNTQFPGKNPQSNDDTNCANGITIKK